MPITAEELILEFRAAPAPRAVLRRLDDDRIRPPVLVLHGFKGFADWGFFPHIGRCLAQAGFAAIAVDFALNGVDRETGEFTRLDHFERNSLAAELDDVRLILASLADRADLDLDRLALVGHSRGGALAMLAAREHHEVRAVATLAAVAVWRRLFTTEAWDAWRRDGHAEVVNARTGQVLRVGRALRDELDDPSGRFDPLLAAREVQAPVLVIHGTDDPSVDARDAEELMAARADRPSELMVLEGADHTFGAAHPWTGSNPHLDAVLARLLAFLTAHIGADVC